MTSPETRGNEHFREENKTRIQESFLTILENIENSADDTGELPVTLAHGNAIAHFHKSNIFESNDNTIFLLNTSLKDAEGKVLSERDYRYADRGGRVVIEMNLRTIAEEESKGYGSGLILLTDDVIHFSLRKYDELQGKEVLAEIDDWSKGAERDAETGKYTKNRNGWSSHYAQKLGFECVDNYGDFGGRWIKKYQ